MDQFANLGYWVRTSCAGWRVAPTAVRQFVAWTFANTSLNRLEIVVAVGNARSQRVAEKVGAHRDAVLKKRLIVGGRSAGCDLIFVCATLTNRPHDANARLCKARSFTLPDLQWAKRLRHG